METQTELQNFFKDKSVFLTGGTGFLGKVFIEKLLRVTEVKRIYVLIRSKRGKNLDERIEDIFRDPLFAKLRQIKPYPAKYISPISGDCTLPYLGLSDEDRNTLIENVDLVVHSAATVRFNEPLSNAIAINVRATLDLISLAKKMFNLKAFVHVSSAFANCTEQHIDERYYVQNVNITATEICRMVERQGAELINAQSAELCQDFPNTYCFTKALAEEAVLSQGRDLPICIFRPCIVVPTYKEPLGGWVDNLYGPVSILFGAASGVLHVLYMHTDANAAMVPVDYCANMMMACACETAKRAQQIKNISTSEPRIYNLVPDSSNLLSWKEYMKSVEFHGFKMPISRMLWFPFLICTSSKLFYSLLCLFYHTIPGYLFDFFLMIMGKKRRMVTTYRKIHLHMNMLKYFTERNWTFGMENTNKLWRSLSDAEKQLFPFSTADIDWSEYMYISLWGMRRFVAKEEPSTVPKALQMLSRLLILHRTTQVFVYGGALALVLCSILRILH